MGKGESWVFLGQEKGVYALVRAVLAAAYYNDYQRCILWM